MLKLLGSWEGLWMIAVLFLAIMYVVAFLYLLVRFARGPALAVLPQIYCLTIVILAIGERIRLLIVDGDAIFWFGAFSLPHALCLFVIIWANAHSRRADGSFRGEPDFG